MNEGGLQFIRPNTLRHLKPGGEDLELLLPSWYGGTHVRNLKYKRSDTAWRNYIAWYLCSSGLSTADVASLLTLSASRVRAVVRQTRKKWFQGTSIETMELLAKHDQLKDADAAAHLLVGYKNEMAAAEYLMTRVLGTGILEISSALHLGRATFLDKVAQLNGNRCGCRTCRLFGPPSWAYWEEDEG